MNLVKAIGTIGGLTLVSRVLGFARDMIASRILGASHANDAFNLAFLLPNIFRRLFAEGGFPPRAPPAPGPRPPHDGVAHPRRESRQRRLQPRLPAAEHFPASVRRRRLLR